MLYVKCNAVLDSAEILLPSCDHLLISGGVTQSGSVWSSALNVAG